VELILAASVALAAVLAWTAWEVSMASRLRRDRRPLVQRNAAVAGAHRLTVVGQLGLVGLSAVLASVAAVSLWWSPVAVATPLVGALCTVALAAAAAACVWWAARRHRARQDRRALLAVTVTALATEVVLRGLGLGLLEQAGWPVTAAVLAMALATGLLQAWRATVGNRAYALVLGTVLGFLLGLVVVLTGSVLAAAAVHVAVVAVGLARALPTPGSGGGCACGGHDHDHGSTGTTSAAASSTAPGTTPGATGATEPVGAEATGAHSDAHASCGSTCDHAGTSACAVCPLSTARV
jgi:hypothetical protein